MRKINIKHILLLIILFTISVPLIQKSIELFPEAKPLVGAAYSNTDTIFTLQNWIEGDFQKKKDKYLEQQFKERNFIVRLNNQINFLAFKKVSTRDVVVGKNNYLFQGNYFNAMNGADLIPVNITKERIRKLAVLKDSLFKRGIYLDFVIAPSKSRYYKEYAPKEWLQENGGVTNYSTVLSECKKQSIEIFDVNDWFLKIKPTQKYQLFPKTGIHWSNYGSVLFTDSLVNRIKKGVNLPIPELDIINVKLSSQLAPLDHDLGAAINLLDSIPVDAMPYPQYVWYNDSTKIKVKALFIADSYLWNIYYQGLTVNIFSDITYNYYNTTMYNDKSATPIGTFSRDKCRETILSHKTIIILLSEPNLQDMGWGFIDWAYEDFCVK
jgi:hypothetical protein